MRKYTPILGFVFVALFAMSTFAPLANAAYTHENITITITLTAGGVSREASTCTKANPLVVTAGDTITVAMSLVNSGDEVILSYVSFKVYTVMTIIFFDWETEVYDSGPLSGGTIAAGASHSQTEYVVTSADWAGQKASVEIVLDFAAISDYTVPKFYVQT